MPQPRARRGAPALALGLAVLAHGLALGLVWQTISNGGKPSIARHARGATQLRLLTPPRAEPQSPAPETTQTAALEPAPRPTQELGAPAPEPSLAESHPLRADDIGTELPAYPDAPLPNGQLQLRRWLSLDGEGRVQALQAPSRENAPEAFARAAEQGLFSMRLQPASLGLGRLPPQLCVELRFIEEGGRVQLQALPQLRRAAHCLS